MNYCFRTATPVDLESLLKLDAEVGKETFAKLLSPAAFAEIFNPEKVAEKIKYAVSSGSQQRLFVCVCDEIIVGYVNCGPKSSFNFQNKFYDDEEAIGMMSTIRIASKHRGKGIGKKLVRACFEYFSEIGMTRIISRVLINNIASHKFCDSMNGKQKTTSTIQFGAEKVEVVIYEWRQPYITSGMG